MIKIKKFNGENLVVTIKEELPDNYVKIQVLAPKESFFFNKEIVISRKSLEKHRIRFENSLDLPA